MYTTILVRSGNYNEITGYKKKELVPPLHHLFRKYFLIQGDSFLQLRTGNGNNRILEI